MPNVIIYQPLASLLFLLYILSTDESLRQPVAAQVLLLPQPQRPPAPVSKPRTKGLVIYCYVYMCLCMCEYNTLQPQCTGAETTMQQKLPNLHCCNFVPFYATAQSIMLLIIDNIRKHFS